MPKCTCSVIEFQPSRPTEKRLTVWPIVFRFQLCIILQNIFHPTRTSTFPRFSSSFSTEVSMPANQRCVCTALICFNNIANCWLERVEKQLKSWLPLTLKAFMVFQQWWAQRRCSPAGPTSAATFSVAVAAAPLLFFVTRDKRQRRGFFSRKSGSASVLFFKQIFCRCRYC